MDDAERAIYQYDSDCKHEVTNQITHTLFLPLIQIGLTYHICSRYVWKYEEKKEMGLKRILSQVSAL